MISHKFAHQGIGLVLLFTVLLIFILVPAPEEVQGNEQPQITAEVSNLQLPHLQGPITSTTFIHLPIVKYKYFPYLNDLSFATYTSILAMVESDTGLPHDKFDATLFDIMPPFATVRSVPSIDVAPGATLESWRCIEETCRYKGNYGLKFKFNMPPGKHGSYNVNSPGFNVSEAVYLEVWVKGSEGGERFEFVLWSNCQGGFPGRPNSALISVSQTWERRRIPLVDFQSYANLTSLCRLSIGFNDAIHPSGIIYLDQIAFVDNNGNRLPIPLDEETNVTNIGLFIAAVLGAYELGWEDYDTTVAKLSKTLTSIETFQKWHGFPQTHNHIVSLLPSTGDRCISTVDLGNFAAGLILLRQRIPQLAARTTSLLEAMEWDWLYDGARGLPYGCRYSDGSASDWHYDWLAADSRLAHFIGIGTGKVPPISWNNLNRTHEPNHCTIPANWHFDPGWDGGGLFMQFLPGIFIDEIGGEIGTSAHHFALDQICYAQQIGAPAWGWSATALPPYGAEYCGYGCVRNDILVPHAAILTANYIDATDLIQNLLVLESLGARPFVTDGTQTFDFGFRASVDWQKGEVASVYLVLDQGMAFLTLVNRANGRIRELFCQDPITLKAIQLSDYATSCN